MQILFVVASILLHVDAVVDLALVEVTLGTVIGTGTANETEKTATLLTTFAEMTTALTGLVGMTELRRRRSTETDPILVANVRSRP